MSEIARREKIRDSIKQHWPDAHWARIEDKLTAGIPDINVKIPGFEQDFWIEAKELDFLPARDSTPIKIGLKREQFMWLRARKRSGGNVRVVAYVERVWMVFEDDFEELFNGVSLERLLELCSYRNGVMNIERILGIW